MQKKTLVLPVSQGKPDKKAMRQAAKIIRKGGLVAFPTETVYGLGANALSSSAAKKIYKAKGRPSDNPLIVHIARKEDVHILAKDVPANAKKLIDKFWPGPLTIIFKKTSKVPNSVSGGLNSVAIRMPSHKIALALIKEAGVPIAAPSANLSGKPSPTSAQHVIEDLFGKADAILYGGKARIGLESTVIDMRAKTPILLRPGSITREQISKVLKIKVIRNSGKIKVAISPGMKYKHYAPKAPLTLVEGVHARQKIQQLARAYSQKGLRVGVLATSAPAHYNSVHKVIYLGSTQPKIARNLFAALRKCDKEGIEIILAEVVKEQGIGLAIMNRLKKASANTVHTR